MLIKHDPVMTLTNFKARSTEVTYAENCYNVIEEKTFWKWANGQNIYDFVKEIDPGVILILPLGYIYMYDHYSQTISQISGEHLQDHWSSCFYFVFVNSFQSFL